MIPESRLAHKEILSPARKARQALKVLRKFTLCGNYSIRESASGFRSKNEHEEWEPLPYHLERKDFSVRPPSLAIQWVRAN